MKLLIIVLLSLQYKGDNANEIGVREALIKQYAATGTQVETADIEVKKSTDGSIDKKYIRETFQPKIQDFDEVIVLGAGLDGMAAFNSMVSYKGKSKFIWTGHQLAREVSDNLAILDSVILPSYALETSVKEQIVKKTKLIETAGVPHDTSKEELIAVYNNWKDSGKIPPAPGGYLVVSIGGDAPDKESKMHYYTKEEAANLGAFVGKVAKNQNMIVLATNNPRTGQHAPETGKKLDLHKKDSLIDPVSSAFLEKLKASGLEDKDIKFVDFKFGEPSALNPFLGAAAANDKSLVIIAGDSSSSVTMAIDLLKAGQVYIEKNQAMSEVHNKQLDYVAGEKWAKTLSINEEQLIHFKGVPPVETDAERAAAKIFESDEKMQPQAP